MGTVTFGWYLTINHGNSALYFSPTLFATESDIEIPGLPPISGVSIGVLDSKHIIGVGIIELYTVTLVRGEQVIVVL